MSLASRLKWRTYNNLALERAHNYAEAIPTSEFLGGNHAALDQRAPFYPGPTSCHRRAAGVYLPAWNYYILHLYSPWRSFFGGVQPIMSRTLDRDPMEEAIEKHIICARYVRCAHTVRMHTRLYLLREFSCYSSRGNIADMCILIPSSPIQRCFLLVPTPPPEELGPWTPVGVLTKCAGCGCASYCSAQCRDKHAEVAGWGNFIGTCGLVNDCREREPPTARQQCAAGGGGGGGGNGGGGSAAAGGDVSPVFSKKWGLSATPRKWSIQTPGPCFRCGRGSVAMQKCRRCKWARYCSSSCTCVRPCSCMI